MILLHKISELFHDSMSIMICPKIHAKNLKLSIPSLEDFISFLASSSLLFVWFPLLAPRSHALSLGFLIFLIGPSLYLLTKRRSNNKHPEVIFSYLKSHTSQSHLLSPNQNKGIPAFNGHTRIYNTDLQYWFHSTSENSYPTKLSWF